MLQTLQYLVSLSKISVCFMGCIFRYTPLGWNDTSQQPSPTCCDQQGGSGKTGIVVQHTHPGVRQNREDSIKPPNICLAVKTKWGLGGPLQEEPV